MNSKRVIAFTLLALISIKTLLVPVVYLDFELRKEYIVKNLCENRFKPQLHCDGKCYLAKTLNKIAEEKAQNEAEKQGQSIKKILEEVFDEQLFEQLSIALFPPSEFPLFDYQPRATVAFIAAVFHPPAV